MATPLFLSRYRLGFGISIAKLLFLCSLLLANCRDQSSIEVPCDFLFEPDLVGYKYIDYDGTMRADGQTLAFVRKDVVRKVWALEIMDVVTLERTQIVCGSFSSPSWSADGQSIVVSGGKHLYRIFLSSDSIYQITHLQSSFNPSWSPSGEWILFSKYYEDADSANLNGPWMIRPDGTDETHLFQSSIILQLSWTPTEDNLLFFRNDSLYQFSILNRQPELLTTIDMQGGDPKFSNDGEQIVFVRYPIGTRPDIWTMDKHGNNMVQLSFAGGLDPSWTPDGKHVIYTEIGETGRIWRVDVLTGKQTQLTRRE